MSPFPAPLRIAGILTCGVAALAGCAKRERPAAAPTRVATAAGFKTPESVKYDVDRDLYYVANINGGPSAKDNNGFISRVSADGAIQDSAFIQGGRGGVTLHAPKGMALAGDTLWVADIDALRAFDRNTGAPLATIDFTGQRAQFLNDVAVGPDGSLYVTDTGIRIDTAVSHPGPDRIFRVGPGRAIGVAAEGDTLKWPNGITWDPATGRFVVVSFGGPTVFAWKPGDPALTVIATGPGSFDGVERLPDGRFLISSWADSSVYELKRDGTLSTYIRGLPAPADIGFDSKRNRVAVPLFQTDRVELWQLPTQ